MSVRVISLGFRHMVRITVRVSVRITLGFRDRVSFTVSVTVSLGIGLVLG